MPTAFTYIFSAFSTCQIFLFSTLTTFKNVTFSWILFFYFLYLWKLFIFISWLVKSNHRKINWPELVTSSKSMKSRRKLYKLKNGFADARASTNVTGLVQEWTIFSTPNLVSYLSQWFKLRYTSLYIDTSYTGWSRAYTSSTERHDILV